MSNKIDVTKCEFSKLNKQTGEKVCTEMDVVCDGFDLCKIAKQLQQSKAECEELKESILRLEHDCDLVSLQFKNSVQDINKLKAENQKCKDTLEFYADEKNWVDIKDGMPVYMEVEKDEGQKATQALKEIGK